jgi:hypothetical protein
MRNTAGWTYCHHKARKTQFEFPNGANLEQKSQRGKKNSLVSCLSKRWGYFLPVILKWLLFCEGEFKRTKTVWTTNRRDKSRRHNYVNKHFSYMKKTWNHSEWSVDTKETDSNPQDACHRVRQRPRGCERVRKTQESSWRRQSL